MSFLTIRVIFMECGWLSENAIGATPIKEHRPFSKANNHSFVFRRALACYCFAFANADNRALVATLFFLLPFLTGLPFSAAGANLAAPGIQRTCTINFRQPAAVLA